MKQVLQDLGSGTTLIADVPAPRVTANTVVIRTRASLVSAGTERMLVEFGKASVINKARQQPDKVRQVLEKARTDGVFATLDAVRSKLDQPLPLGYCNAGVVVDVGAHVTEFKIGDRVVSNGQHAEIVRVPRTLVAKIPEGVPDEQASFAVLGSIALQGIRLAAPTLGETFVVMGLGLIGLVAVQLLRANGCRVIGMDLNPARLGLARDLGADVIAIGGSGDPVAEAMALSRGRGVDGVIVTASTASSEPMRQAAQMSRKRGRIVLVGVTGLELSRADFYEKELTFQVSCSYGPGRYDSRYEEQGNDYPLAFVRWTEQRNFEAMLDMIASSQVDVGRLITHRFAIEDGARAFETLTTDTSAMGIVLGYPVSDETPLSEHADSVVTLAAPAVTGRAKSRAVVALIGAGNYGSRVLAPALKASGARLKTIVSSGGVTATHHGRKQGFELASTAVDQALDDAEIDTVVIATRHDTHATLATRALRAGKHVFVEKPLALTMAELDEVQRAARESGRLLMVGFNRRFAPHVVALRRQLVGMGLPKSIIMTINAGAIPAQHWTQDDAVGGGRIVGEACHFVDLARCLAGAPITSTVAHGMTAAGQDHTTDTATLTHTFADGSTASIHYFANGSKSFPKERIEVFAGGRVAQVDNFVRLRSFGWPGLKNQWSMRQDKGQAACIADFIAAVREGRESPIPLEELVEVSAAVIVADQALKQNAS